MKKIVIAGAILISSAGACYAGDGAVTNAAVGSPQSELIVYKLKWTKQDAGREKTVAEMTLSGRVGDQIVHSSGDERPYLRSCTVNGNGAAVPKMDSLKLGTFVSVTTRQVDGNAISADVRISESDLTAMHRSNTPGGCNVELPDVATWNDERVMPLRDGEEAVVAESAGLKVTIVARRIAG
ncbi:MULTISPECIES: hypothetical protein [Pandoraea]|uniref:Lipoprotein n=2 Tax=Pandoraea TaxID=93217 RepID=A0A5E4XFV6_9BURK|nr:MULTISPECIES: hypothetical protein [Pandoraea]VVE17416.1 hypothetical protein PCE31107_02968 [Pandoraea cepalis]VVE35183.1 hypothetical protein PTE31013_03888 [Pandoraea terrigena]